MPTRVQRLKKRSTRVADRAVKKMNKVGRNPTPGSRSAKVLNKALKKGAKIDKKIVKTKARVATRAKKKMDRVVKKKVRKLMKGKSAGKAWKSLVKTSPKK